MSATQTTLKQGSYALGHTPQEYERLRAQARGWETATGRLLDQVGLRQGTSCLDAGCGPGETMRMLAERVGPAGRVLGVDADLSLGTMALGMLHDAGHRQCGFHPADLTGDEPIPGAPFDLVYARLLLFHLPQRVAVLGRLWNAVAPGGCLVIQDYDLRGVSVLPSLFSVEEAGRVITATFEAAGADVHVGARLAQLFAEAGVGTPDGTDVAGRIEPLATGRVFVESAFRSLLPAALAHGIITHDAADALLSVLDHDAARFAGSPLVWPLLIGAWKRKEERA